VIRIRGAAATWAEIGDVGEEALARTLEGTWLRRLGRNDEAEAAFQRALDLYGTAAAAEAPDPFRVWRPWAEMRDRAQQAAGEG
jgi:predicted RNA polymerase sigma factor